MPELVLSKVIGGDFFMGQREYILGMRVWEKELGKAETA
jgi:hypothetical protein